MFHGNWHYFGFERVKLFFSHQFKTSIWVITLHRFYRNYGFMKAAALSYYAFLTFIPIVVLFISFLGLFLQSNATATEWILAMIQQFTPTGFDTISQIINHTLKSFPGSTFFGIIGLVWSLLIFFSAIENSFNQIWELSKRRHFVISKMVGLGLMLLLMVSALLTFLITNMVLLFMNSNSWSYLSSYRFFSQLPGTLIYLMQLALLLLSFFLIYKVIPAIRVRSLAALCGALFAALAGELARWAYRIYVQQFSMRNLLYGSLLTAVILLIWLNYTMIILLLGCELSCSLQRKWIKAHE